MGSGSTEWRIQVARHLHHCHEVTWVQLRCKATARLQYRFMSAWMETLRLHAPRLRIIVNDRVDIALALNADGIHVGQDDLPVEACRTLIGPDRILGFSTHTLAEVAAAGQAGGLVDYIGFGPVHATASKPDALEARGVELLRAACQQARQPLVAIGGMTPGNAALSRAAGATAVAMISGLFAPQGILHGLAPAPS
jgi:thiamine-phosphate pyrophosphorylase